MKKIKLSINYHKSTNFLLIVFIILLTSSCNTTKTSVVWTNSMKPKCITGAGTTQCISIYKGDNIDNAKWQSIYTDIEGFVFKPGYYQKIEIKEEHLDKNKVPADASSIKYVLVKTLEKKEDKRFLLNDVWVANRINGNLIDQKKNLPRMEINLAKMQVMGNNGCNNYIGKIKSITSSEIQFGNIATTRKMCINITIPDFFDKALNSSSSYKLKNTELTFFDKEGNETINFMKID